ncbi:hypothetical protein L1049_013280 [Liquidambar formosana]|uniref:Uncharacterized protein n=1 Tax=Liquidambar formosana TaxID=63359 RepID=A0AAP0RPL9_LIQFO
MGWLQYIDSLRRLEIPVLPLFQADVPDWTGPPDHGDSESDTSKWLGTRTWPIEGRSTETKRNEIGKGRRDSCSCTSPGSMDCIKLHTTEKRIQLQFDLGPAFWSWKFDEMGEEVSKSWTPQGQKAFKLLVKRNPISQGKSFLKPALQCFPSKRRESIVSYYFNVFLPRRISKQTRAGCTTVDTDDDEAGEVLEDSRKRNRDDSVIVHGSKSVMSHYMIGRR